MRQANEGSARQSVVGSCDRPAGQSRRPWPDIASHRLRSRIFRFAYCQHGQIRYTRARIPNQAISLIMHVNDLLRLNGTAFVRAAYAAILKREADHKGLDHFTGRLALGDRKETILVALATSSEARGSKIDLVGLPTLLRRQGNSPWRRFLRFLSDMQSIRQQLARIEYLLGEQGAKVATISSPIALAEATYAPRQLVSGDDLNVTLVTLQDNLSNTAHDAELFIGNFRKTIRSSPLFFSVGR